MTGKNISQIDEELDKGVVEWSTVPVFRYLLPSFLVFKVRLVAMYTIKALDQILGCFSALAFPQSVTDIWQHTQFSTRISNGVIGKEVRRKRQHAGRGNDTTVGTMPEIRVILLRV